MKRSKQSWYLMISGQVGSRWVWLDLGWQLNADLKLTLFQSCIRDHTSSNNTVFLTTTACTDLYERLQLLAHIEQEQVQATSELNNHLSHRQRGSGMTWSAKVEKNVQAKSYNIKAKVSGLFIHVYWYGLLGWRFCSSSLQKNILIYPI